MALYLVNLLRPPSQRESEEAGDSAHVPSNGEASEAALDDEAPAAAAAANAVPKNKIRHGQPRLHALLSLVAYYVRTSSNAVAVSNL